jgi:hypothetical protein
MSRVNDSQRGIRAAGMGPGASSTQLVDVDIARLALLDAHAEAVEVAVLRLLAFDAPGSSGSRRGNRRSGSSDTPAEEPSRGRAAASEGPSRSGRRLRSRHLGDLRRRQRFPLRLRDARCGEAPVARATPLAAKARQPIAIFFVRNTGLLPLPLDRAKRLPRGRPVFGKQSLRDGRRRRRGLRCLGRKDRSGIRGPRS